jgi:hypothetical protein
VSEKYRRTETLEAWDKRLILCSSTERAALLVRAVRAVAPEEGRQLLRDHWTSTDATRREWLKIVAAFEKCGFVTDTDKYFTPDECVVIYRGDLGDGDGISWTTDLQRAEWFARYCRGPRAAFVGIPAGYGVPTVWRAEILGQEVLGYFDDRKEQEVVLRPLSAHRRAVITQGEQSEATR